MCVFSLIYYYSTEFSTLADAVYAESSHIILICLHLFLTPNTLLLREMHLFSRKSNELLFNNYVIALRTALSFLLSIFCRLYVRLCIFLMVFFFCSQSYGCCCRSNSNRIQRRRKKIIILHKCRDIFSFVFVRASYHVSTVLNLFHKSLHSVEFIYVCVCVGTVCHITMFQNFKNKIRLLFYFIHFLLSRLFFSNF